MDEYGIFSDESADWSEEEAIEAGFYSQQEAEMAIRERYSDDDELTVHVIEEPEEEEDEDEDEEENE